MANRSKRKQAELFMQYPPLWDHVKRLMQGGKLPDLNIRVTRADTHTMDYQLRETPPDGRSYVRDYSGKYDGLLGVDSDVLFAVDDKHEVRAVMHGRAYGEPARVRDLFSVMIHSGWAEYLLLLTTTRWHQEPTPEERERDVMLGKFVAVSLDAYVLRRPAQMGWGELCELAEKLRKEREEAYLYPPKDPPKLDGLEQALHSGARLHAFRSGSGLRVVRLERRRKLVGYGEHPDIAEALRHADEDFLAGGREYKSVYGAGKLYPHYLTGSSMAANNIDLWVLQGHTIDAWANRGGQVVVQLKGFLRTEHPEGLEERVLAGETVRWEQRGFTYESTPSRFPNGEACFSTKVVAVAEGVDPRDDWMYMARKTGKGNSFWEAAQAALEAEAVPVKRS